MSHCGPNPSIKPLITTLSSIWTVAMILFLLTIIIHTPIMRSHSFQLPHYGHTFTPNNYIANKNNNKNNNNINNHHCYSTITSSRNILPNNPNDMLLVGGGAAATVTVIGILLERQKHRTQQSQYEQWERKSQQLQNERAKRAYIEPRDAANPWTLSELSLYDGTNNDNDNDNEQQSEGPILLAVNGIVYNVWKGRHFYGPGCEYHVFAGRDATRLLAKNRLVEETEEERAIPLSVGEKAALQGWLYTFRNKYEVVGTLEGFDPSETSF
mmetsp:Transcript_16589/g.23552  ORF Transcript_16589/g.23552 Transcript_16589/m.23552 type:complete len:269 (+) Transcript_16589:37-843(+)